MTFQKPGRRMGPAVESCAQWREGSETSCTSTEVHAIVPTAAWPSGVATGMTPTLGVTNACMRDFIHCMPCISPRGSVCAEPGCRTWLPHAAARPWESTGTACPASDVFKSRSKAERKSCVLLHSRRFRARVWVFFVRVATRDPRIGAAPPGSSMETFETRTGNICCYFMTPGSDV